MDKHLIKNKLTGPDPNGFRKAATEVVKYLLNKSAPAESKNDKRSVLRLVAMDSNLELIEALIATKVDINKPVGIFTALDNAEWALEHATGEDDKEIAQKCVDLLKKHGAKRYSELPKKDASK